MKDLSLAKEIVRSNNGWLKSHGLGNEYIVFNSKNIDFELNKDAIIRICNTHYGIGSDGILLLIESDNADFGLRIFNPDGSEAEKSGNGIRIFADYLYRMGFTDNKKFTVEVGNELVRCEILLSNDGETIENIIVDIGKATFTPSEIPVNISSEEALDMELIIGGQQYLFSAISVGNPHAVCIVDKLECIDIKSIGSEVENNPIFPNRINVQLVEIVDKNNVKIEIWERGAGYTLASGSSSCAVVSVLYKKGLVCNDVSVHMPGGTLHVLVDEKYRIKLKGPVVEVAYGVLF